MIRELDDLDEPPVLEGAADDEAGVDELLPVRVVDLIAMPVTLVNHCVAVQLARPRPLGDLDGLRAQPHRPAEILDSLLLRQEVDHRERRLRIHLRRVRSLEPNDMPRELGDRDVHPETDAEIRDPPFARDAAGIDLNDANIKTTVRLHHGTHFHPFVGPLTGRAGSFTIPPSGAVTTMYFARPT